MYRDDLRYDSRLTECLAYGHKSVEWRFSTTRRAWCSRCSRTWPIEWLRLLSMAHIEPIEVTFATISDRCRRPDVRSREERRFMALGTAPTSRSARRDARDWNIHASFIMDHWDELGFDSWPSTNRRYDPDADDRVTIANERQVSFTLRQRAMSCSQTCELELRRQVNRAISRALVDDDYAAALLAHPAVALCAPGCLSRQHLELGEIRASSLQDFASQALEVCWPSWRRSPVPTTALRSNCTAAEPGLQLDFTEPVRR